MKIDEADPLSADDRLGTVLAACLEAIDRGEPDLQTWISQYPEFAAELKELFAGQARVDRLAAPLRPVAQAGQAPISPLGDFRILREVGRGGMGIVYEAEQISLGRRVALKVLPFAATMDPRHLQRFQNEARAAASLEHPHIVPVHGVGCERGVHYYAMKFIEGQSLADVIGELKKAKETNHRGTENTEKQQNTAASSLCSLCLGGSKDFYKTIAELGIQAAEALEHAHSVGIVHRDIKPANLMIDGHGKLWVTDFGLARTSADAGLTMTGDVLGTLRYMSPEQALAKHGLVDHRTDVYSLGVTLYELLTGRPAVGGKDRQEILNAITLDEPQSPRTLNAAIPRDLETIVLRAIAKELNERYPTAKELADDLRRLLEYRPIRARPPTLLQRIRKLGQRHRQLLRACALFLIMVVVGLAVSVSLLWHEKEQTKKAFAEAQTNYKQAENQRRRAETNFREAFWVLEDILSPFDTDRSAEPASAAEVRHWQTDKAIRFLAPFCEDLNPEPGSRLQKGAAWVHTGRVHQVLGDGEKAQKAFRQSIAVFEGLVHDFPDNPTYVAELSTAWSILGDDLYHRGQIQEGRASFSRAIRLVREAVRKHPTNSDLHCRLACWLCCSFDPEMRNPAEAVAVAQIASELAPAHPYSWMILGIARVRAGKCAAAVAAFEEALRLQEDLTRMKGDPGRGPGACTLFFLAMAQWQLGNHELAKESYRKGVRRMEWDYSERGSEERAAQAEAAILLRIKTSPAKQEPMPK